MNHVDMVVEALVKDWNGGRNIIHGQHTSLHELCYKVLNDDNLVDRHLDWAEFEGALLEYDEYFFGNVSDALYDWYTEGKVLQSDQLSTLVAAFQRLAFPVQNISLEDLV